MGQIVSASEDYVLPLSTMEVQSFCDNIQALPGQCTSMEAWCEQLNMSSCRTRISLDLGLFLSGKWRQRANSCFSRLAPSNSSYTERCCLLLPLFSQFDQFFQFRGLPWREAPVSHTFQSVRFRWWLMAREEKTYVTTRPGESTALPISVRSPYPWNT